MIESSRRSERGWARFGDEFSRGTSLERQAEPAKMTTRRMAVTFPSRAAF